MLLLALAVIHRAQGREKLVTVQANKSYIPMDLHSKQRGIRQIRWKYVDLNYGNYMSWQRVIPRDKAQMNVLEVDFK
jgi:hypothetical protein